ncbi:MAG: hypothetical protein K8U03_21380 [Planctomycetia bacterium]|nr:hypothetical protein [Planctomycetia bacterium]
MRRVLLSLVAVGGLSLFAAQASAADHSPFQLLGSPASATVSTAVNHDASPVTAVAYRPYYGYNRGYYGYNRGYGGGYRNYGSYYRGGYGGYGGGYRPYGSYYRGGYGGGYGGYPGYYGGRSGIGIGFGFY